MLDFRLLSICQLFRQADKRTDGQTDGQVYFRGTLYFYTYSFFLYTFMPFLFLEFYMWFFYEFKSNKIVFKILKVVSLVNLFIYYFEYLKLYGSKFKFISLFILNFWLVKNLWDLNRPTPKKKTRTVIKVNKSRTRNELELNQKWIKYCTKTELGLYHN